MTAHKSGMATARLLDRWEWLLVPTLIFIFLRLITGFVAYAAVQVMPAPLPNWIYLNSSIETYTLALPDSHASQFIEPWHRYDTVWYVKTAIRGYEAGDPGVAFPPLFSVLTRLTTELLPNGQYVIGALIVSNIACWAAFVLLYALIKHHSRIQTSAPDKSLAFRALLALAVFPTAFYLVAGYTESLFLALSVGAFLAAYRRQWWIAGLLTTLASLTRFQGIVLCIPMAIIALDELHTRTRFREITLRDILTPMPAILGGAVGIALYVGYLQIAQLGSIEAAYSTEWRVVTRPPWVSVLTYIGRLNARQTLPFEQDNALILALMVASIPLMLIKLKPVYVLFSAATLGMLLLRVHEAPQFEGMFRYALSLFPFFMVIALLLKRWWMLAIYVVISLIWQIILIDRFTHWIWVS